MDAQCSFLSRGGLLGPQTPRASGLGLGFTALDSVPPLMVPARLGLCGKGQSVTAQRERSSLFQRVLGPSLVPDTHSSADMRRVPPTYQAFREGPQVGPWGVSDPAGDVAHSPACPLCPCVCPPAAPKGQAPGLSSCRPAIQPRLLRLRARGAGLQGNPGGLRARLLTSWLRARQSLVQPEGFLVRPGVPSRCSRCLERLSSSLVCKCLSVAGLG